MSAGTSSALAVVHALDRLAPKFQAAVEQAIAEGQQRGLKPMVYETYRSPELQAAYFARGRTVVPPNSTVTNAQSNLFSWHGFGLAVDVIHQEKEWDVPESWFTQVAECFRAAGCRWGGEWKMKDLPHFQWGLCKPSPSDVARSLMASGGMEAVWKAVGAV
jgi:hypothetical protein